MNEGLRNSLVIVLLGHQIAVDTPIGLFQGTLLKVDTSQHRGISNLLIETWEGQLLLIRLWTTIKRKGRP
jgi:hypothetical protein